MNSQISVRLSSDSNFIPVKYKIVEMTTAATAGATYCVLIVARVGWDTSNNYDLWKATSTYDSGNMFLSGRDPAGIVGVLGTISVVALDTIVNYGTLTPSTDQ